jgi:hypothetical protein
MGSYGRNFEFRITPTEQQRRGRIVLAGADPVVIGAPLVIAAGATPSTDFTKALPASLATTAQPFKRGFTGIGIYEHLDYNQFDPEWVMYSDRDTMPTGKLVQLIIGPNVKVVFRNTADRSFMGTRDYQGRVMVAGLGATPTVAVGDYLTPGTGNDTAGYWAETGSAANAWLVVTNVDAARQEVEAELL